MKLKDFSVGLLALAPLLGLGDEFVPVPAFWSGSSNLADVVYSTNIDCRTVYPVASLDDEALKGLMYSANSWELNASADASRTATITAQAGSLADGVFTPDDSGVERTVLPATTGEGTVDWALAEISKKVYRLTHMSQNGGAVDAAGTCYGYFDFTRCVSYALQEDVEAAVLGAITHEIAVIQDELSPWQPLDSTAVRSGIETDELLAAEETTATTFTFRGRGVLHYEYDLSGGTLAVVADGEEVSVFAEETAGWVPSQVLFDGFGTHEVSFNYTAVGNYAVAAIRNVRWEEEEVHARADGDSVRVCLDLRGVTLSEGVLLRTPVRNAEVLPFTYSSTNWIGGVSGATAASAAKVTIVQLTGTSPDVTTWTESGTPRVLRNAAGEGEVKWNPKKGVWKATFDIRNGDTSIHHVESFFDLRNSRANGMAVILF